MNTPPLPVATPVETAAEPGGFSWAALVYGPFYYAAMRDWSFMVISALAGLLLYTIPILIPLAFFARKRAWQRRQGNNLELFTQVQRQWDRSAIVGVVVMILVFYFASRYMYSMLSSTFGTSDPNAILQQVQNIYQ